MGNSNLDVLEELGFTPGERKVYLSLFETGESSVGPISKESGITHAKVYPILDKLIRKGLVSHVIREGRKYFSATDPRHLLDYIDEKARRLSEKRNKAKVIIPELVKKSESKKSPQSSRVFEGFNGLKTLFYELFDNLNNSNSEILVFGLGGELKNTKFINFFLFYHELRRKNKIATRMIFGEKLKDTIKKDYKKMYTKKDEARFIKRDFPTGIFIFEDHVISIVFENNKVSSFDICSAENVGRYEKFFESLWKIARK